jgi:hypothetical protein
MKRQIPLRYFGFSFTFLSMRKRVTKTFTLTIAFIAGALTLTARADEGLSQFQTALGSTAISGFSRSDFTFTPPRNPPTAFSAFDKGRDFFQMQRGHSSLSPIPQTSLADSFAMMPVGVVFEQLPSVIVDGSPLEIQVPVQNSMNVNSENSVNLTMSEGVDMMEISRGGFAMQPIQNVMPPTPDFQIRQAEIQPATEPSTFALGGLAVVLIAIAFVIRKKSPHFLERKN